MNWSEKRHNLESMLVCKKMELYKISINDNLRPIKFDFGDIALFFRKSLMLVIFLDLVILFDKINSIQLREIQMWNVNMIERL